MIKPSFLWQLGFKESKGTDSRRVKQGGLSLVRKEPIK